MRTRWVLAAALACGWAAHAPAQDAKDPTPRDLDPAPTITLADLDRRAAEAAYDATVLGTDLFNKGSHEDCFWLYHGTLTALVPVLDHRSALVASIKLRLVESKKKKELADGAFVLREALDDVQALARVRRPGPGKDEPAVKKEPAKPLWDRLGGEKGVRTVVKDFLEPALKDPAVNFSRNGKYKLDEKATARLEQVLVEMLSDFAGGPLRYTGEKDMKKAHAGMKVTDKEFDALASHLARALAKNQVPFPEAAEVLKVVAATRPLIVGQ